MSTRRRLLQQAVATSATSMLPTLPCAVQAQVPPVLGPAASATWQNWSGIERCTPTATWSPSSVQELADGLRRQSSGVLRCVGAGHSFTGLVPTSGTLLSLDRLSGLVRHDVARQQVTVRAGTRLAVLNRELAALGLALHNLPDINVQTLGGAFATGTHGTGIKFTALHDHIIGLRLTSLRGEVIHCSAQDRPELFAAAKVSLGALGVLTEVDLSVRTQYYLRKRVWTQSTDSLIEAAPQLAMQHRNFEFYVLPHIGMSAGITHDEVPGGLITRRNDKDEESLLDLKRLRDALSGWPRARSWLAKQFIGEGEQEVVVDLGWKLLSTVRNTRFNETEFHVPREKGLACLREVLQTLERRPEVFFPLEFRFVKADKAWLSPFHEQDSCSIAVHALGGEEYRYLMTELGPIFRRHGGRPHWGKLHDLRADELARLYPRWADFQGLRASLDPQGRLLNPYLRHLFGVRA